MKRSILTELKKERPKDISKACRILKTSKCIYLPIGEEDDSYLENQLLELSSVNLEKGFGSIILG
ncbi:MAG: hypothetical protein R2831_11440 [Chitinophagaceae bacterium]